MKARWMMDVSNWQIPALDKAKNRFERRIAFSQLPRKYKKAIRADKRADRDAGLIAKRISGWTNRRDRAAKKHAANLAKFK